MGDKRQATQAAWVAPQSMPPETSATRTPSVRGEISTGRILGFLALAVMVALAVGYLALTFFDINVALAVFVVALLGVFAPFFVVDSAMSSGLLHRRAELGVESAKIDLDIIRAAQLNEAQDAAIRALQSEVTAIKKQIANLRTIEIHDREGSRTVSLRDEVDTAIDVWLTQTMFDAAGRLIGTHKSGVLKGPYQFKGPDENSRQAHSRLQAAGLITTRQPGNQYCWIGPATLHATMDALAPLRDEDED